MLTELQNELIDVAVNNAVGKMMPEFEEQIMLGVSQLETEEAKAKQMLLNAIRISSMISVRTIMNALVETDVLSFPSDQGELRKLIFQTLNHLT